MSPVLLLVFCAAAIYVSYIPYGIFQEAITSHEDKDGKKFAYPMTVLLFQVIGHTVVSAIATRALKENPATLPLKQSWMPGITFVSAMFFSNVALQFVSYPTQALAKSSKMIPVMIGGLLFRSERYSLIQYLQVVLVTIGIAIFQWKSSATAKDDFYGITFLLLSLFMDGLTGPKQRQITKDTHCTSFQLMFSCNIWALLLVFLGIIFPVYGEGLNGLHYILAPENHVLLIDVVLFAACSALGSSAVFFTLKMLGPLRLTLITTTRKFFTIFASVIVYGHHLTFLQWCAVMLVLSGVALEMLEATNPQSGPPKPHTEAAEQPSKKKD